MTIRHIVMWRVRGADAAERLANARTVQAAFEGLRGRIPGLLQLELGVDESAVDYACDVVLLSTFADAAALAAYADHPEHLRVRRALGDMRSARFQVDYAVPASASGDPTPATPAHPGGDAHHVPAV